VSSTKAQATEKSAVTIADLFSKCSELAAQEQRKLDRISRTMLPILAWLNEPVQIKSQSAFGLFPGFKSITLHPGATVVMVDSWEKATSRPLASFSAKECLAILEGALAEFERLLGDKKRGTEVRPGLSIKAVRGGAKVLVDMRTYRLVVTNSGGDCHALTVSVYLPGGEKKTIKPCDVGKGERVEVDLGIYKELGTARKLKVELECSDVDGRELAGLQSVPLEGKDWQEAVLSPRK
jgi:hypothetical protein